MTLNVYNTENLADGLLKSGITAGAISLEVKGGRGGLYPLTNFWVKAEQFDNSSPLEIKPVLKREIIFVTNRSGDIFAITKGAGNCPQSDTAITQTNTPLAFDENSVITHIDPAEYMNEIRNAIQENLTIADYISGAKLFADSTTGTDAYQVTLPEVTSYAQIDGQMIRVRVDVGNTADATIQINALSVIDIKKFKTKPLVTGDVKAGQIMCLVINNASGDAEIKDAIDQTNQAIVDKFQKDIVLGEAVTAGDKKGLVFNGSENLDTENVIQSLGGSDLNLGDSVARERQGFFFTSTGSAKVDIIRNVIFNLRKVGIPVDNIEFNLFESDKTTPVAGFTQKDFNGELLTAAYIGHLIDCEDGNVVRGTQYFLEFTRSGALDVANYYQIEYRTSNVVTGYGYSTYDGAVWTDSTNDLLFNIQYGFKTVENKVYGSDSRYPSTNKYDGVVIESGVLNEIKRLVFGGDLLQTLVEVDKIYYINTLDNSYTLSNPQVTVDATIYTDSDTTPTLVKTINVTSDEFYGDITAWVRSTLGGRPCYTEIFINGVSQGVQANGGPGDAVWNINEYLENGDVITFYLRGSGSIANAWEVRDITTNTWDWVLDTDPVWGKFSTERPVDSDAVIVGKGNETTGIELMTDEQNFKFLSYPSYKTNAGYGNTIAEENTPRAVVGVPGGPEKIIKLLPSKIVGLPVGPNIYRCVVTWTRNAGTLFWRLHVNGVQVFIGNISASGDYFYDVELKYGDVVSVTYGGINGTSDGVMEGFKVQYDIEYLGEGEVLGG